MSYTSANWVFCTWSHWLRCYTCLEHPTELIYHKTDNLCNQKFPVCIAFKCEHANVRLMAVSVDWVVMNSVLLLVHNRNYHPTDSPFILLHQNPVFNPIRSTNLHLVNDSWSVAKYALHCINGLPISWAEDLLRRFGAIEAFGLIPSTDQLSLRSISSFLIQSAVARREREEKKRWITRVDNQRWVWHRGND
jgi:hypothetical protein